MMPGKVNPVLAEALLQTCAHVIGGHAALTHAAALCGSFELHTAWPLASLVLVQNAEWLGNAAASFALKTVDGIVPTPRGPLLAARSLMAATALVPAIGYDAAAAIAKKAAEQDVSVYDVARADTQLGDDKLGRLLDPAAMLGPFDTPECPE